MEVRSPERLAVIVSETSQFKWTQGKQKAALALAQGYTETEAAKQAGVVRKTIQRWKNNVEFAIEVDRLTLMVGIASRAERLRIAMRVIQQKLAKETVDEQTKKDLLDWLKFVQSETDGAKFDLALVFEAMEKTARDSEAD